VKRDAASLMRRPSSLMKTSYRANKVALAALIRTTWMYLYRAVDAEGNTLEFLLSPTRDAEATKRFFVKVLHATAGSASRACPTDEKEAQAPHSILRIFATQPVILK
jgi:IS6 family transposase